MIVISKLSSKLVPWFSSPRVDETNGDNISVIKMDREKQQQIGTQAASQNYPEDVCPVVLPSLVQRNLLRCAELWWAPHNTPLSRQAASQLRGTQQLIMGPQIPRSQLPVPKHCAPAEHTHTHTATGSGRTAPGHKQLVGPERAQPYSGCHTHESTRRHSHT